MADATQPLTLGMLQYLLGQRPEDQPVRFDFCGFMPTKPDSYRGFYDHLAFGYTDEGAAPKVGDVMAWLNEADGHTYEGYKGGDFTMGKDTPLWVANWGRSDSTAITGISGACTYMTVITTAHCEDWAGGFARAVGMMRQQGLL